MAPLHPILLASPDADPSVWQANEVVAGAIRATTGLAFALQTLVENAAHHGPAPRVAATEIVEAVLVVPPYRRWAS